MMTVKEILIKSISNQNKGVTLEENIKDVLTGEKELDEYFIACILYNYNKYDLCLEQIKNCYEQYDIFDASLFCYALYSSLEQKMLDEHFLYSLFKIIIETQDIYSQDQIDIITEAFGIAHEQKILKQKHYKFLEKHLSDFYSAPSKNTLLYSIRSEVKEIVHCFYNDCSSGVGDFLRGSCFLHTLCKSSNINLKLDFSKHDLGVYLKSSKKNNFLESDIFDTEKTNKNFCGKENYVDNIKNNLLNVIQRTNDKKIFIFTNYSTFIDCDLKLDRISLTKQCQNFMQSNLTFSKEVEKKFKKLIHVNHINKYNVCHFRLGDKYILYDEKDNDEINFKKLLDKVICIAKDSIKEDKKIILLSDSNQFKKYCLENMPANMEHNVKIMHTNSTHCSNVPGKIEHLDINKEEKRKNMLYVALDMKIITQASKVHSYSVYPWGSGFSFWLSKIYNIPLDNHAINHKRGGEIDWLTQ